MMTKISDDRQGPYRVGFLLVENFTLISLSSALEPLRIANLQSGRELYSWALIGSGSSHETCSDGIAVSLDYSLDQAPAFDLVIVVGGVHGIVKIIDMGTVVVIAKDLWAVCFDSVVAKPCGLTINVPLDVLFTYCVSEASTTPDTMQQIKPISGNE